MKKIQCTLLTALLALVLVAGQTAWAQEYWPESADSMAQPGELFYPEELDELLAPIALYPDPLIAQILPAATFIDQIDEAARYINQYGQAARIDDQPWDVSVKAVAHYPDVLFMMDQKYEWSASLGQAYVNQPQDVFEAIQRLRAEAMANGNLVSTAQQEVIVDGAVIRIVPAQAEVIYLPSYDPMLVYAGPPPMYGFITFGIGFTIGPWLNRDCDWHRHRIYHHGWRGRDWIDRSRHHVNHRRSAYTRNTQAAVNVNRRVVQHDTLRYREDIRRNVEYRREHRATPATPWRDTRPRGGVESRGAPATPGAGRQRSTPAPATNAPRTAPQRAISGTPPPPRTGSNGVYRGREPKGAQPAAATGYGGYGSGRDAKTYRERGQISRGNMQKSNRPQPAPASGAQPGASGGRQAAPGPAAPRQAPPANRGGGEQRQQR